MTIQKDFRVWSRRGKWFIDYRVMGRDVWLTTIAIPTAADCCRLIAMWTRYDERRRAAS